MQAWSSFSLSLSSNDKKCKKNFENIWTYILKTVEKMPIFKFEIQLKIKKKFLDGFNL